jgi:uncharacterized membrane protein YcaP (DUF421 family)
VFESIYGFLDQFLGLQLKSNELGFSHMVWRAITVFVFAVVLVRLADRRFLGRYAGFDVIFGVILGSVLSRGINGQAAFFPTLGASAVLVVLHGILSTVTYRSHTLSQLVKGRARTLVCDGKIDHDEMRRCKITIDDLDENLRINGNEKEPDHVAEARLERNGSISVVRAKHAPRTP